MRGPFHLGGWRSNLVWMPEINSKKPSTGELIRAAWKARIAVPGFNIPYLPMMEPTVRALRDTGTFGLIMVARLEWVKFQSGSIEAIRSEYERVKDQRYTRLHLDHVPVIDEDNLRVDFEGDIRRAVAAGYGSVMVDGSRLSLEENIACTRKIAEIAHASGVAVEGELGAVMGHEAGPMPPYDELFASGKGFTDPQEAARFVRETGVDWLSVAIGNVHGAIAQSTRGQKKIQARLSLPQLEKIQAAAGIPLVLHGGTGIRQEDTLAAIGRGIAKINVATATRQPYERLVSESLQKAQEAVYQTVVQLVTDELKIAGSAGTIAGVVA
jgi:ketose-bisphosphate aldolase